MKAAVLSTLGALMLVAGSLSLSSVAAQEPGQPTCHVSGTWSATWGEMDLSQSGSNVTGAYSWDAGILDGSMTGLVFTGKWLEAPSYSEPNDAGDVEFVFSEQCTSFSGKWRYGSAGSWSENWSGTKLTTIEPEPEHGVIERDGKLDLVSPPDGPLMISRADLPEWARDQVVVEGALAVCAGPTSTTAAEFNAYGHVQSGVILDGRRVVREGDLTDWGGLVPVGSGSSTIFVNGVPAVVVGSMHVCPGFTGLVPHVGGPVLTNGSSSEHALDQPAKQGDSVLEMESDGIEVGDTVLIGDEPETTEAARVADRGSLVLDRPLMYDHPAGAPVFRVPDDYAEIVLFVEGGNFIGGPPGPGINFGVYTGGPAQGLPLAAPLAASFWVTQAGQFIGYLAGSPSFVNQAFIDHFTSGIPPNTPLIVLTEG